MFLYEDHVNPDRVAENDAVIKKLVEISAAINHPYPWTTAVRTDLVYYYVIEVEDYADVEKLFAASERVWAKGGAELASQAEGNSKFGRGMLYRFQPDLSYIPDPPVGDLDTDTFRRWGFFYGKPGHEAQIEDYFKKFCRAEQEKQGQGGLLYLCGRARHRHPGVRVGPVRRE